MEPSTNTLDVSCPVCAAKPVVRMLPTNGGAYCRCTACGKMWHQEGVIATGPPAERHPRRRQADGGADAPTDVVALRRRLAQLEWENAMLRQSAIFFGDLAERLNTVLRAARRSKRTKD